MIDGLGVGDLTKEIEELEKTNNFHDVFSNIQSLDASQEVYWCKFKIKKFKIKKYQAQKEFLFILTTHLINHHPLEKMIKVLNPSSLLLIWWK